MDPRFRKDDQRSQTTNLNIRVLSYINVVGRVATVIACVCGGALIKDVAQAKTQIALQGDALCEKYKHNGKNKKFGIENIKQQVAYRPSPPAIAGITPNPTSYHHLLSYPNQYGPLCIMAVTNGVGDVTCILLTWRFKHWLNTGAATFGWDEIGQATLRRDDPFVKEFVAAEDKKELDALRALVAKWPAAAKAKLFNPKTTLEQEATQLRPMGCGDTAISETMFGIHACALPQHDVAALFDYGCKKVLSVGKYSKDKEELKQEGEKQEEEPESDIDRLDDNKIKHIIEGSQGSNHKWDKLVPDKNWQDVKKIIKDVMTTGTNDTYKGIKSKVKVINGETVEVAYVDKAAERRISNASIR